MNKNLLLGDCLEVLKTLSSNSIDSVVTDPPYGLSFMGKKWDYEVPSVEMFKEILRVLKPGGQMLCACGTRTQHRMAVNIEDAGFEIRDVITWLYGSGFPKSMDISKAIDKQAGAEREVVGKKSTYREPQSPNGWDCTKRAEFETAPATEHAKQWQGFGTALKPACEFFTLARKPLSEKTVAANVLKHGTGGINIDGCRIETDWTTDSTRRGWQGRQGNGSNQCEGMGFKNPSQQGRWPANLILDEEAAKVLDEQSGNLKTNSGSIKSSEYKAGYGGFQRVENIIKADQGGASRFFYVAKASKSEKNHGCDQLETKILARSNSALAGNDGKDAFNKIHEVKNNHPTVKPIKLMTYLCRLITPPNGTVLDPFMGSGSTGVAAIKEGFSFVGIERDKAYFEICKARIGNA